MDIKSSHTEVYPPAVAGDGNSRRRISWGAIFAGALMALVVQILLSMLGLGIGLSTIHPLSEDGNPAAGLGVGALIWWLISGLISLFAGGWFAGRLAGMPRRTDSTLHGVLTWGLATLITFYLLTTSIGALISGATSVVGKGLSLAGQGVAAVAPQAAEAVKNKLNAEGIDTSDIRQEFDTLLRQTGKPQLQPATLEAKAGAAQDAAQSTAQAAAENPQGAEANFDSLMKNLFREGKETVEAVDREAAVSVIVQRTGKPQAEAEQIVDRWITTWQTGKQKLAETVALAKQKAREAGEKAAAGLSKAALMAFFGLLLGAGAAALGGRAAAKVRNIDTDAATPLPLSRHTAIAR